MSETTYPSSLDEAARLIADSTACLAFWTDARWPGDVVCPHCESSRVGFIQTRKIWNCKSCRKQFSIKTQSLMEDSAIPLEKWTLAIWLFANTKAGITSVALAEHLAITQKTAWFMLHRIRFAVDNDTGADLTGTVEVDEVYLGGKEKNKHRDRQARFRRTQARKMIVAGLSASSERGRVVRVKLIERADSTTLQAFVKENVQPGSTIHSDEAFAYKGLGETYDHRSVDHSKTYVAEGTTTNHLEAFWTQLKGMWRSYVSFDSKHAPAYLEERVFRFNNRGESPGARFFLLARGMFGKRLRYEELTAPID